MVFLLELPCKDKSGRILGPCISCAKTGKFPSWVPALTCLSCLVVVFTIGHSADTKSSWVFTQVVVCICRLAFFVALDVFDHLGLILRSAIYMVMYYSFAQPRAIIWQMYLVTYAIMYACTGMAYLLSQVSNVAILFLALSPALIHSGPADSICMMNMLCAAW